MPAAFAAAPIRAKSNTTLAVAFCVAYTPPQCDQLSACLRRAARLSAPHRSAPLVPRPGRIIVVTRARTLSPIIKRAPLLCGGAAVAMHAEPGSDDDDRPIMMPCRATTQRAASGGLQAALDSWVDLGVSVEHTLALSSRSEEEQTANACSHDAATEEEPSPS
ncbi:hypothetical protein EYF80_004935 [Liparis tanakae]|uniref:Uncharacterized protein n=1 Tax=Liparis tanakae TaxID=230148 RepID=A0A4Z2J3X2_9TELE|nr:hypothetical protein EYF80_004935 [Liparis tanakae]